MFTRAIVLAAGCSALVFGCGMDQRDSAEDTQEIIDNLKQVGYPDGEIMEVDGLVYVGRDAVVSLEASREMLLSDGSSEEQYRTNNLVSRALTRICVNAPAFTGIFSTALNNAIANYTNLALTFNLVRTPATGCQRTIQAVIQPGLVGGSAGFPSGGNPFGQINIGGGLNTFSVDVIEHVITHELGHCFGFRHSDWFNRSISCGAGGNEGAGAVGAVHIPGTPTGAVVGGSLMNSCFRSTENGEFTASDLTALNLLY